MRRVWVLVALATGALTGCFTAEPVKALARDCTTEVCDGIDNDCDGQIDEGLNAPEICDGADNDCDGQTDEDNVCPPACVPSAEVCNGRDDDCDTLIDEGLDGPELCDGFDNNCNNQVDEGFHIGDACDGGDGNTCVEGVVSCASTTSTQCVEPAAENVCVDCMGDRDPVFVNLSHSTLKNDSTASIVPGLTGYGVAWDEGDDRVIFAILNDAGQVVTQVDLAPADTVHGKSPAVAFNGTHFAVVWMDAITGPADTDRDILFQLIDTNGVVQLTNPLNLSADPATKSWFPRIAWAESQWFVVWESGTGGEPDAIRLRRVEATGDMLENGHTLVTPGGSDHARELDIAYAAQSDKLAVVWSQRTGTGGGVPAEPFGCFFSRTDDACTGGSLATASGVLGRWPHVDSDGTSFGIAWHDERDGQSEVYFSRRTSTGAASGTANIRITNDSAEQQLPDVAWNGSSFSVAWEDLRNAGDAEIYTRVVFPNELKGPEARLTRAPGQNWRPAVAAKNGVTVVSWADNRAANGGFDALVTLFRCVPP